MLLSSADCIQNDFFKKLISEIPSVSNSVDLTARLSAEDSSRQTAKRID